MGACVGSIESALERLFREAKQEIVVAAYAISSGADPLFDWLEAALARGVRARLVINRLWSPFQFGYSWRRSRRMADAQRLAVPHMHLSGRLAPPKMRTSDQRQPYSSCPSCLAQLRCGGVAQDVHIGDTVGHKEALTDSLAPASIPKKLSALMTFFRPATSHAIRSLPNSL